MVETQTKATVFVNPAAGWGEKGDAKEILHPCFAEYGIDADIEFTQPGMNLADSAAKAVAAGSDIVVAGGGDGTLSATASALVGTDIPFGILPVGTLNHFARDLGLPLDLEAAARIVGARRTTDVDIAEVNGKTFLNNSIIGLYPVFRFLRAEQERKGMPRKLALLWAIAGVLRRLPVFTLKFIVNGEEIVRRTPYVLVANNEHAMQGWQLGQRRSLTEGKLWIYVMRWHSRWDLFRMFLRLALGRFNARYHFEIFSAEEMYVDAKARRIGVALDGEIHVMETPLRYRSLPRSLRVIVP